MSTLERRLQVLIDHDRFGRLEAESAATGRSIGAIVRSAIDLHLSAAGAESARAAAARRVLTATADAVGNEPEWADSKADIVASRELSDSARG